MASEIKVDTIVNAGGDNDSGIDLATNDTIKLNIAGAEKARMDSSGNVLIGHTSLDSPVADGGSGMTLKASGEIQAGIAGTVLKLNRETSEGTMIDLRKDGSTVGSIGANGGQLYLGSGDVGLRFRYGSSDAVEPFSPSGQALRDDAIDLGHSSNRFDDIFKLSPAPIIIE